MHKTKNVYVENLQGIPTEELKTIPMRHRSKLDIMKFLYARANGLCLNDVDICADDAEWVPNQPSGIDFLRKIKGQNISAIFNHQQGSVFPCNENEYGALKQYCEESMTEAERFLMQALSDKMCKLITAMLTLLSIEAYAATTVVNGIEWGYEEVSDGIAIVDSKVPDTLLTIDIPDYIDGLPVVQISAGAVASTNRLYATYSPKGDDPTEYMKIIYQLRLPRKIKRIHRRAFFERTFSLLMMPETLEELDQYAFGYWVDGGYHSNGTSFSSGAYPIGGAYHGCTFVFWGALPKIINPLHYSYSSSFINPSKSSDNYMFWSCYVLIEESLYYPGMDIKQGNVRIGFADIKIMRSPQNENGYGNIVTLASTSTNNPAIYYTLDGSDPSPQITDNCFLYSGESLIFSDEKTIKAMAYVKSYPYAKTAVAEFKKGMAIEPVCKSTAGSMFNFSKNEITLSSLTEDAVIHYSIDGSSVTENSPIYAAPFEISETTTVRAKAFKEDWFASDEVVQTFTRIWRTNETPVVTAASETFSTVYQEVSLSCETEGATIYYTVDGSEPSATNGRVYKGPFDIYQTTTVKAIAVKDDWRDSAVVSATYTKANALSEALNFLNALPETQTENGWTVDTEMSHDGVSSVRSGAIEMSESTGLQLSVKGAGRLSFWWRAKCEEPDPECGKEGYYDYCTFSVGGNDAAYLAGEDTGWQQFVTNITTGGKHVLRWEYSKDDATSFYPDCVWVDQVQWLSAAATDESDHTLTTETKVPYTWLDRYGLGRSTDFESAAKAKSGKLDGRGRELTVEDDYITGTDPTNVDSRFEAKIDFTDGEPRIRWQPDLNEGGVKALRTYKILGREGLDDATGWEYPTNALHRFFKVTVEMP